MGPSEYLPVLPICLRTVSVDLSICLSVCPSIHPSTFYLFYSLTIYLFIENEGSQKTHCISKHEHAWSCSFLSSIGAKCPALNSWTRSLYSDKSTGHLFQESRNPWRAASNTQCLPWIGSTKWLTKNPNNNNNKVKENNKIWSNHHVSVSKKCAPQMFLQINPPRFRFLACQIYPNHQFWLSGLEAAWGRSTAACSGLGSNLKSLEQMQRLGHWKETTKKNSLWFKKRWRM